MKSKLMKYKVRKINKAIPRLPPSKLNPAKKNGVAILDTDEQKYQKLQISNIQMIQGSVICRCGLSTQNAPRMPRNLQPYMKHVRHCFVCLHLITLMTFPNIISTHFSLNHSLLKDPTLTSRCRPTMRNFICHLHPISLKASNPTNTISFRADKNLLLRQRKRSTIEVCTYRAHINARLLFLEPTSHFRPHRLFSFSLSSPEK